MPHIRFTAHLLRFFPELKPAEVSGATVAEVVTALNARHPGFSRYVTDEHGALRRHVNIFVNGHPVTDRNQLSDALDPGDEVFILQALSGG